MKKDNKNQNETRLVKNRETIRMKFINTIKKRWLINKANTLLLIAILILVVIFINLIVRSFEWTPIDCTSNKQYTLTRESKDRVNSIGVNVNIYLIGYEEESEQYILVKQYNKANENINVEKIDLNVRTDIASKYNLSNNNQAIVVENGDKSRVLYSDDLSTYDSSYNTIDLTEEKVTSAILNVTSEKIAKVYFLSGYSNYGLDYSSGMYLLSQYLNDEVLNYENLDILVKGEIPEDCDTLVITTPSKDFDEFTTNKITEYINKGGNILWLNSSYSSKQDLKNVNKILAMYGVNPFDEGYIYETDKNRMVLGYASCIVGDTGYSEITKNLNKVILLNSSKININEEQLEQLNVKKEEILTTTETTYFRKDVSNTPTDTKLDEQGPFVIGAKLEKTIDTIKDENVEKIQNDEENSIKSELIIYGDNNFASDIQISSQVNPMIFLENNKDVVLNSVAYLTNQKTDITIRKNYLQKSSFTPTDGQKLLIMRIVFAVPITVVIIGIIVWQDRRRKK